MMEEQTHASTKAKKPGRITRRTLALLLVLAVVVWGAASLTGPRPPFRFLEEYQCIQAPHPESWGSKRIRVEFIYCANVDYDNVVGRVRSETIRNGWVEGEPRDRLGSNSVDLRRGGTGAFPWPDYLTICQDMKLETAPGAPFEFVRGNRVRGWTTIYGNLGTMESIWQRALYRIRKALHL